MSVLPLADKCVLLPFSAYLIFIPMYMKYAIDQQMVVISAQNPVSIEFHRRQFINVQQIWVQRLFE